MNYLYICTVALLILTSINIHIIAIVIIPGAAAAAVLTPAQLQEREGLKAVAKAGNELLVWLTEVVLSLVHPPIYCNT
jgi:hypothetical protein